MSRKLDGLGIRGARVVTRADTAKAAIARTGKRPLDPSEAARLSREARKPANKRTHVKITDTDRRRSIVLNAAVEVAKKSPDGVMGLRWDDVAKACAVQTSGITARRMFKRLVDLRDAVVEHGRLTGDRAIIEQAERFGLVTN